MSEMNHVKEVEILSKDAARYRWLRDKANSAQYDAPMVSMVYISPFRKGKLLDGDELDEAIDFAMSRSEG